jgi:probable phosphoglycerate mutase
MLPFYPITSVRSVTSFEESGAAGPADGGERPARGELWLVRHGETEWSASGRHTSRTDVALTERGAEKAVRVGHRLTGITFDRVLTSPLTRARETCRLAGFGDRAEVVDDLREWDYGDDEGRTTAEIRDTRPGWTVWDQGPAGGETAEEVGRRADRVVALARGTGGRVLAFSHGHISRVIGARWIELPVREGAHLRLDTASIAVLGWERETPVLQLWNSTDTLPGAPGRGGRDSRRE